MVSIRNSSCTALLCFLTIILGLMVVPFIAAQSRDGVHAVPRDVVAPKRTGPTLPNETSINIRFKPLHIDVDLVIVPVTVTDAMNRPVTHLRKEDFLIYENNKLQAIQHFSKEDEPISIGLVLDFSQSMTNKIETEREAVSEFLNSANSKDEYFAIAVSSGPTVITELTSSKAQIEAKLAAETPKGETALLDAIYLALAKMRSAQYQRRALLIVSDGGDNNSRYRLKQIKDLAQEADVPIYAIGLFDSALFKPFEEFMGRRWLQEITDATGGRTVTVDNLQNLPEVAGAISWELRNQYVLAYRSDNPIQDGKRRQIKVKGISSNSPVLQFHYKRSYFVADK
jgi:Ca-activated chloride channel family protein